MKGGSAGQAVHRDCHKGNDGTGSAGRDRNGGGGAAPGGRSGNHGPVTRNIDRLAGRHLSVRDEGSAGGPVGPGCHRGGSQEGQVGRGCGGQVGGAGDHKAAIDGQDGAGGDLVVLALQDGIWRQWVAGDDDCSSSLDHSIPPGTGPMVGRQESVDIRGGGNGGRNGPGCRAPDGRRNVRS